MDDDSYSNAERLFFHWWRIHSLDVVGTSVTSHGMMNE